jgi:hypothetical protein
MMLFSDAKKMVEDIIKALWSGNYIDVRFRHKADI